MSRSPGGGGSSEVLVRFDDWDRRRALIDQKQVGVSNEQWRFMQECSRDNVQEVHSVRKELQELQITSPLLHCMVVDRLDKLEERFQQEMKREQTVREADVRELRELIGRESMARDGQFEAMRGLLTEERLAREAHVGSVREFCEGKLKLAETHIQQEIKGSMHEVRVLLSSKDHGTREAVQQSPRSSDKLSSVEGKLDPVEGKLEALESSKQSHSSIEPWPVGLNV
ncbi:unnamed protein product [Polarella glacialis]|uniref:Uncharacterized protein n=1 Tax=Polarella glacialis TaxID=89957 RepID=A0A813EPG9_POLGL|nr:unnamed protein product [Polarella glacialis]